MVKLIQLNKLAGIVSFDDNQEPEYSSVNWKYSDAPVAVIHRLAVRPSFQGKGLASKLMAFAENAISRQGFSAIRLDAYSGNSMVLGFYKKLGFQKAGEIYFPYRSLPFVCLEKSIKI